MNHIAIVNLRIGKISTSSSKTTRAKAKHPVNIFNAIASGESEMME